MSDKHVELPILLCLDVLEKLNIARILLDPPPDFKPWKFDEPEEHAREIGEAYSRLLDAMTTEMAKQEVESDPDAGSTLGKDGRRRLSQRPPEAIRDEDDPFTQYDD